VADYNHVADNCDDQEDTAYVEAAEPEDDEDDASGNPDEGKPQKQKPKSTPERKETYSGGRKATKKIVESFLKLFAVTTSRLDLLLTSQRRGERLTPQASFRKIHQASQLKAAVIRLLARSEPQTQKLAVECLAAGWNKSHITPYKESIIKIIDEKQWRNEITNFPLDPGISSFYSLSLSPLLVIKPHKFVGCDPASRFHLGGGAPPRKADTPADPHPLRQAAVGQGQEQGDSRVQACSGLQLCRRIDRKRARPLPRLPPPALPPRPLQGRRPSLGRSGRSTGGDSLFPLYSIDSFEVG